MGSNLGEREANLCLGLQQLSGLGQNLRSSSIYETEPWGKKDQPLFLNCVAALNAQSRDPEAFLHELQKIEVLAGRSSGGERWGPRALDLDILFWGTEILNTANLIIPHPEIARRRFVLVPLAEISPELLHPVTGKPVQEMLDSCSDFGQVTLWGKF